MSPPNRLSRIPAGRGGSTGPARPAGVAGKHPLDDAIVRARKIDEFLRKLRKWKQRIDQVRSLFDKETGAETAADLAVEWLPKLIDKVFETETPFSQHPYFEYHKVHMEIYRELVRVASVHGQAEDLRREAERALAELESNAQKVLRDFDFGHERWERVCHAVADWVIADRINRSTFGLTDREAGRDILEKGLRGSEAEIEGTLAELMSHWAALDEVAFRVEQFMARRAAKHDELWAKPGVLGLGRLAVVIDREHDEMADRDRSLTGRAAASVNDVRRRASDWAARIDRQMQIHYARPRVRIEGGY